MTFNGLDAIEEALERLGKLMLYDYAESISLVVCGGGALNAMNIASMTTKDVDVLVIIEETDDGRKLKMGSVLPQNLVKLIADVGRDLRQDEDWLNMGPKNVLEEYGVPGGMVERLEKREYGPALTLYFIHRTDQIYFKVLAAADPNAKPHHMEDLKDNIKPDRGEVQAAMDWLLDRKTEWPFRNRLRYVAAELGYDDIVKNIPE